MSSKYNTQAADIIATKLWYIAKTRSYIHYNELSPMVGLEPHNPIFWQMLGEISTDTNETHGVLLSALVVNHRDGYPGNDFFNLAKELGRGIVEKTAFWVKEVHDIHKLAQSL